MLNKQDIYDLLNQNNFNYEVYDHTPAYTIEEMEALNLPYNDEIVKNLFLRDDKKKNFYLIVMSGHKSLNLKTMAEKIPSRKLSFANENELWEYLMLKKGHVTPLGILNNKQKNVIVVFDKNLKNQRIGIHPIENNATIFIDVKDVIRLIENHGNVVLMTSFE